MQTAISVHKLEGCGSDALHKERHAQKNIRKLSDKELDNALFSVIMELNIEQRAELIDKLHERGIYNGR